LGENRDSYENGKFSFGRSKNPWVRWGFPETKQAMKNKPNLILISCPKSAADNTDEITTMIQPQMPGIFLQVVSANIPANHAAIYRPDCRLDMRRVL